ncbi:MAG TPA: hypothetical protein VGD81_04865 [Opitutaceae bacterium]
MRFVWFLAFWGWSKESFRVGLLLRHPLENLSSTWDEWYQSEASVAEREAINEVGASEARQREFIAWLEQVWRRDAVPDDNRLVLDFLLQQLAQVPPFDRWPSFATYRAPRQREGVAALVIAEGSDGNPTDVRGVEAVVLPLEQPAPQGTIVADDFRADSADLNIARQAAAQVLGGPGLWRLYFGWLASGRRFYAAPVRVGLTAGWLALAGLLVYLRFGPDPGENLRGLAAGLLALWLVLLGIAAATAIREVRSLRKVAQVWNRRLAAAQVRLRMPGRLTLKGGSAGLAFCLQILFSLARAYPEGAARSSVWSRFLSCVSASGTAWAVTGALAKDGTVQPVQMAAKIRACARHPELEYLLGPTRAETESNPSPSPPAGARRAERSPRFRRCRHVAGAIAALGGTFSPRQALINVLAVAASGVMVLALPDLHCILLPPPAPAAVAPASASPYYLWVSLDTRRPAFFQVALESTIWVNRRSDVAFQASAPQSVRAEIRLARVSQKTTRDFEDGIVWIERRPCLLGRKYASQERVGRYTVAYLNRLAHE